MKQILATVATLIWATSAQAALQQCYDDQETAAATMVFQIVDPAIGPIDGNAQCTLTGEIAQAFRGPHGPGARIQTIFNCAWDGTVGARTWVERDDMIAAPVVEVHIRPEGGAGTLLILDAVTGAPVWRGVACDGTPLGG